MGRLSEQSAPASKAFAITPHDTNLLAANTRFIFVGGAGALKVDTTGGDTVTLTGCTAGSVYPIRAKKVYSTGTTATSLVALH